MNTCRKCAANVPETLTVKTGYKCKTCVAEYNKAYREANKERIAAKKAAWKQRNAEYVKQKDRAYALANPDKRTAARKKWVAQNPEKDRASKKEWLQRNPEKRKVTSKTYMEANKDLHRAFDAKRKAAKKNRTPSWLTEDHEWMIREAYELAVHRNEATGLKWEVDHILPISGELVSGLHVPWNLQVVTRTENRMKSNKLPSVAGYLGGGW